MKNLFFLTIFFLANTGLSGQGIDFFHGTWEEALAEAEAQQKVIFVDAYAVWCGPCKRMANNVFTNSRVGDFYNNSFINLKLDMESEENMTFRQKYPVSAFPTLYYIDFTGEVVHQVRGAQDVEGFIRLGEMALGKVDRSEEFAEAYEKGDRSPETMFSYVQALNQAGKPSQKISNEYIRSMEDKTTPENLRFILEATVAADSRIFNLLIKNRKAVEGLEGVEAVQHRILYACENTAQKAAEYKTEVLLDEAQKAMSDHYPAKARQFKLESDLEYYLARRSANDYLKAAKAFNKKGKPDSEALYQLSQNLWNFFQSDSKCVQASASFAEKASETADRYDVLLHYARILNETGKKAEAIEIAKQALELAKPAGRGATMTVEMFLQQLEG